MRQLKRKAIMAARHHPRRREASQTLDFDRQPRAARAGQGARGHDPPGSGSGGGGRLLRHQLDQGQPEIGRPQVRIGVLLLQRNRAFYKNLSQAIETAAAESATTR
jgi:hypothetical protein